MASGKSGSAKSGSTALNANSPEKQLLVLEKMIEGSGGTSEGKQFQIHELAAMTGHDEREVQRSLYILEGHKYVAPCPPGDFTSKTWQLTKDGQHALEDLNEDSVMRML